MRRLGIYGGSFNPVHLGHLLVAQAAREELELDRVFFVPAAVSPFKPDRELAAPQIRLQLLRIALAGQSFCEIDEQELIRGGISYTIDTVRNYAERFPGAKLFYLIGSDQAPLLPAWRDADELARLVDFAIVPRQGALDCHAARDSKVGRTVPGEPPNESNCGLSRLSGDASPGLAPPPFRSVLLAGFPFDVSASQIRGRVKSGLSIDLLVPRNVAQAIQHNRLYL